jgi:hypothetical protein
MPKKNSLKPKQNKKKIVITKFKSGLLTLKKILKQLWPNSIKKANRTSIKKNGGKTINTKIPSLNLSRPLSSKSF